MGHDASHFPQCDHNSLLQVLIAGHVGKQACVHRLLPVIADTLMQADPEKAHGALPQRALLVGHNQQQRLILGTETITTSKASSKTSSRTFF